MRSNWIEYNGKKIFYQDFSKLFYNSAAVKQELTEVEKVVSAQPLNSALVLSDFRDTNVGRRHPLRYERRLGCDQGSCP